MRPHVLFRRIEKRTDKSIKALPLRILSELTRLEAF